jgi:hypothetical protein
MKLTDHIGVELTSTFPRATDIEVVAANPPYVPPMRVFRAEHTQQFLDVEKLII